MDIDDLLALGSQRRGEKSPLQRKQEAQKQTGLLKESIIKRVTEVGVQATAAEFCLSESAVAKLCVPLVRKGDMDLETIYPSLSIADVEEYIFMMNTTSIKRLLQGGSFNEAELRLVKAHIEGKQRGL